MPPYWREMITRAGSGVVKAIVGSLDDDDEEEDVEDDEECVRCEVSGVRP